MSFILDALKKLEHKQKQGSVPHVLAVQESPPEEPKKRITWPYIIIAALLLNFIVLAVWIIPRQSKVQLNEQQVHVAKKETETVDIQSAAEEIVKGSAPSADEDVTENKPLPEPDTVPLASEPKAETVVVLAPPEQENKEEPELVLPEAPPPVEAPSIAVIPPLERPVPVPEEATLPIAGVPSDTEGAVTDLQALPENVRRDIPKIVISGHIYSNNSRARLVNVNGSIVREGETAAENLKVEEITPEGAIFNFNGRRFRVRAF
jgi:general secretion pathway protein B